MGSGVSECLKTCMVAILVAAMCALIREYGGFDALLGWIHKIFRGKKGGHTGKYFTCGYMVSSPLSRSENAIRKVQDGQE